MKAWQFYSVMVVVLLFPFLAVWTAWVMTAASFDAQSVFQSGGFWGFTLIYYTLLIWFPLAALWETDIEK